MDTLALTGGKALLPDGTVETADVLVDREGGTIAAVGGDIDGVNEATETIDTTGCVVIPGLVNAHTHVSMTLLRGYADDTPLETWLREEIWPVEAALTPDDIEIGAELGAVEMIRSGTTTFADMYFSEDRVASVVDRAGMRALLGHGAVTIGKDEAAARADIEESVTVAAELDGAADGRIRTAVMPHSLTTVGERYLREAVEGAADIDVPIHLHANETVDEVDPIVEERGIRPMEYAEGIGALAEGNFFAHGVHLDATEIDLLAESGTSIVHCPASNMKLASGMAPVQDLLDVGVTVALGTDGAASNNDLDLFDEMRDAAMVGKIAAGDAAAVPAESVLRMATAAGADALGLPGGRIAEGEAADLAVVDLDAPHLTPAHDVISHLVYAVRGSDVRDTICNGRVLMRDRELTTLDPDRVMERASAAAADLIARAEGDT